MCGKQSKGRFPDLLSVLFTVASQLFPHRSRHLLCIECFTIIDENGVHNNE